MSEPIELRCRRGLWLVGSLIAPRALVVGRPVGVVPGTADRRRSVGWVVLLLVLWLACGMALMLASPAWFYAIWLAIVLVPALALLVLLPGGLWWATGGGQPVLQVVGDEVRVRVRAIRRDELPNPGPRDPNWWDLRLNLADVRGVRIARSDRRAWRWYLALDVAPERAAELMARPGLARLGTELTRRAGSPVAWMAGAMLPWWRRRADLRRLVEDLERARAAVR